MRRGLRRALLGVGTLALLVVLGAGIAVYLLLQPDRFTAMLQQQAQRAGLALNLAAPASPSLFPRPALALDGITLAAVGADDPILVAAHGRLVLPWRTLLGGPVAIAQMQLEAPRVDIGALQSWLATLPPPVEGSVPAIPRIDAGIGIDHGSVVRGDQLLLNQLSVDAGTLAPDQPFTLSLAASTASNAPLRLRLGVTPHLRDGVLQLDDIAVHLAQGSTTTLSLSGNARWHGGANASAQLGGKLDQAGAGSYTTTLALTPADQTQPLLLQLQIDGPGKHTKLQLPPLALAHWWSALNAAGDSLHPAQPVMPPLGGSLQADALQVGSVHVEGLRIQSDDSAPAAASSAAQP